jgi:glycosyltransferase involved in cell wall biosynthesis
MDGGGSERQTVSILRHLDRARFTPDLWLVHRRGPLLAEIPADVPIHECPAASSSAGWNWPGRIRAQQIRALVDHLRSNQTQIVYDRTFHMTLLVAPAAQRLAIPRVSTIVSPPDADLVLSERRWRFVKRWVLADAYRSAQSVLAVSEEVARSAIAYYRLPERLVQVLPSGIEIQRIRDAAEANCDWPPGHRSDRPTVALIGRCTAEKGHEVVLEALALLPTGQRPQVMMVGDGPLRAALQQQTRQLALDNDVLWLGYVRNPYPFIRKVTAIIAPSRYEGRSNVILESLALGTTVLASPAAASGLNQLPNVTMVRPATAERWAEALGTIGTQFPLDSSSRQAAIDLVCRQFDIAPMIEQLSQILEVAAHRGRNA